MTQTIVNLGTGGAALNGQNGSTSGADSNDALFLDWTGENYVYLPGVNGNRMTVPDEAALDITGDIDLRAYVALDDWTSAVQQHFIGKRDAASDISYAFSITPGGRLALTISANGTSVVDNSATAQSTEPVTAADGSALWVRGTLDVDNGAGGRTYKYFTSDDGTTWTQLGSDIAVSGTTSIHVGALDVRIGDSNVAGTRMTGKVYRAQILDGIDGTPVLDVDCSQITSGAAESFTALTGQTVTINRSTSGRKSVAVVSRVWLFGTDDSIRVDNNDLLNFNAGEDFTIVAVCRIWDTKTSQRPIVNKREGFGATQAGWALRTANNVAAVEISDGSTEISATTSDSFVSGQLYVATGVRDAGSAITMFIDGSPGSDTTETTTGNLVNDKDLRIAQLGGSATFLDAMELIAVAVYRRALTPAEIAQVTTYYQARLS